ncbi:MAG: OadG family protein [Clostridia bacterium]|nr:OadG family protein [Clostridia bacterium]
MNAARFLIVMLLILVGIIVLFALVDWLMKNDSKKKETKVEQQAEPKAPEAENKEEAVPTMKIYNNELADDLNEIIQKTEQEHSSRLKVEKHTNKEGNISKYIKRKNYQEFDFGNNESDDKSVEEEGSMSFTMDDYKRIMALSNIDDKK